METGATRIWKNRTDDDEDFIKYSKGFANGVLEIVKANYKMGVEFKGEEEFDGSAKAPASKPAADKKEEEVKSAPKKSKRGEKGSWGRTCRRIVARSCCHFWPKESRQEPKEQI